MISEGGVPYDKEVLQVTNNNATVSIAIWVVGYVIVDWAGKLPMAQAMIVMKFLGFLLFSPAPKWLQKQSLYTCCCL